MSGLGDSSSGIYLEAKTGTVKFLFFLVFSCRKQLSFPYVDIIDGSFWKRPTYAYGSPIQGLPAESLNSVWEGSYWTTSIATFVLNAHPPSTYPSLLENLPTCPDSTFYHSTTMTTANTKLNIHNM